MIPIINDALEIEQELIIKYKDSIKIISPYPIHRITHRPSYFYTTNLKDDPFIVDWQLAMEETIVEERQWY